MASPTTRLAPPARAASPGGGYRPPGPPGWRLRRAGGASRGVQGAVGPPPERPIVPEAPIGG
eukprot:4817435-Alexandrium_andersonii.AAC.1